MKSAIKSCILLLAFILLHVQSFAQCAMCNATAESSLDSGSTAAKGLNAGVLYLFVMPLLFFAFVGYWFWKNRNAS